jgi:flagellar hook-associated protein 1 FlgK
LAASGIANFSSILTVAFSNPRRVAAALDLDPAQGSTSFAQGDSRNIQAIANLRNKTFTFSTGNFSFTGRFDESYNNIISTAGNSARRASTSVQAADQKFLTASAKRDEISGVSLDEEFTNLVRFQRAFQASARVLRVADQLLEQVVNLL